MSAQTARSALEQTPTVDPLAAFLDATTTTLSRSLRTVVDGLAEPRVSDPDRALQVLRYVVETLTGFAVGAIANAVLAGVRRWFGDEVAVEIQNALRGTWPVRAVEPALTDTDYLRDAANRPLVDMLASQLHVRFGRVGCDASALLAIVSETIERRAPHRRGAIASMLELITRDETLATSLVAELTFAWTVYNATIVGRPFPSTEGRWHRSKALWEAWHWKLGGRRAPVRTEIEQAGFIMLVR